VSILLLVKITEGVEYDNIKMSEFCMNFLIIVLVLTSSAVAYNGYNELQEEYTSSDGIGEYMDSVESYQGRTAVPPRGFTQSDEGWVVVDPGVFFHLHGNRKFANGYFSPVLTDIYSNITYVNMDVVNSEMVGTDSTPPSYREKLYRAYGTYIMKPPSYYNIKQPTYGGQQNGVSVSCVIYPNSDVPNDFSIEQFNMGIAQQVGFEEYKSTKIDSDYISGNFTRVCSV
jgi:hypothetical protein